MSSPIAIEHSEVTEYELKKAFAFKRIGDLKFEGLYPLSKPAPTSRGVYGGNLCGQSILVALETVEDEFTPHSLHSYFVRAGNDKFPCQFEVEKVSDGRSFSNRLVRVTQEGKTCYIIMISLTKKNSIAKTTEEYKANPKKPSPFEFQKPAPNAFHKYSINDLKTGLPFQSIRHKFLPEYLDVSLAPEELERGASERDLSMWLKIDNKIDNKKLKYAAFAVMSDSQFLSSLSRILHLYKPGASKANGESTDFFSVSLDHSIYFHDDCIDPTKWIFFNYSIPRFSNNRALYQGNYYNANGKLVASMVQEGLIIFSNGYELRAKL